MATRSASHKDQTPLDKLPVEAQICRVFGKQCALALAVSQAENGTRKCDRLHANTNGSVDVGVFQINASAHSKKAQVAQLVNCTANILVAKQIYDASGWYAWSAYNNGLYKKFLTK